MKFILTIICFIILQKSLFAQNNTINNNFNTHSKYSFLLAPVKFLGDTAHGFRNYTIKFVTVQILGIVWYITNSEMNERDYRYKKIDKVWFTDRFITSKALRLDNNIEYVNVLFHPFAGTFYYLSARTSGYNPCVSLFSSFWESFFWEYIVEYKENPSINDLILTPFPALPIGEYVFGKGKLISDFKNTKKEDYLNGLIKFSMSGKVINFDNKKNYELPLFNCFFSDTAYNNNSKKVKTNGFSKTSQYSTLQFEYSGDGIWQNNFTFNSEFLAGGFFFNKITPKNIIFNGNLSPIIDYEFFISEKNILKTNMD